MRWAWMWWGSAGLGNLFGFRNEDWKPWTFWDGTPLLVPGKFNTEPDEKGDILMYVDGDRTGRHPHAVMPNGGFYFDSITRQGPIDDDALDPEDNASDYGPISAVGGRAHLAAESERLYTQTDKALMMVFGGTGFGDIALVPGPWVKRPKGIRDVAEWYMSTVTRKDYVMQVFERQCEIAMENLPRVYAAVGDRVTVAYERHRFRVAECLLYLAKSVPHAVQAVLHPGQRLDPRSHAVEDLHPLLRLDPAAHPGHHRGRVRHSQPRPDLRHQHGPG